MNKQRFHEYLNNPALLNESSVIELKQVVDTFPWFQTAQLLYAKALSATNHYDYYSQLKKTSISVNDRKVLYLLLNQEPEQIKNTDTSKEESTENLIETRAEIKPQEKTKDLQSDIGEIKFVSNTTAESRVTEIQIEKVEKQIEIEKKVEHREEARKIELQITPKVSETEKKIQAEKIEENNSKTEESSGDSKTSLNPPLIDEIILNPVVNAYIEKEVLHVTDIHKTNNQNKVEGLNDASEKVKSVLKETLNEPHSFTEWLKLLSMQKQQGSSFPTEGKLDKQEEIEFKKDENKTEDLKAIDDRKRRQEIMDKIIQNEPGHIRMSDSPEFFNPTKSARGSNKEDDTLVTETLAWIYEQQGNYPKAIRAYQTLSLKFPEKSVYFAGLIQKIKLKQKQK